MSAPARFPTLDLYQASSTNGQVWASGANGTIFHYTDAGGWAVDTAGMTGADTITGCPKAQTTGCGKPGPIYSIFMWPDNVDHVIGGVAVGGSGSGLRLYYNGTSWERHSSGTSTLLSVTMAGTYPNSQWWACGLGGVLYFAATPNHFMRDSAFTTPQRLRPQRRLCRGRQRLPRAQ